MNTRGPGSSGRNGRLQADALGGVVPPFLVFVHVLLEHGGCSRTSLPVLTASSAACPCAANTLRAGCVGLGRPVIVGVGSSRSRVCSDANSGICVVHEYLWGSASPGPAGKRGPLVSGCRTCVTRSTLMTLMSAFTRASDRCRPMSAFSEAIDGMTAVKTQRTGHSSR